jgi:hypothetical protein
MCRSMPAPSHWAHQAPSAARNLERGALFLNATVIFKQMPRALNANAALAQWDNNRSRFRTNVYNQSISAGVESMSQSDEVACIP